MSHCVFLGCKAKRAIRMKRRASFWIIGHLFGEKPDKISLCEEHNLCSQCAQMTAWDDSLCMYCDPDNK
uniref:Uncharacterized protein n=1 Tax=viral metagenome TaxID=1070528 RepID=A0A6C0CG11_9ZZZZ